MRSSICITVALSALAFAAPTFPHVEGVAERSVMDKYFNTLAKRVAESKRAGSTPVYDISKAVMPQAPMPLAGPSTGLTVKHVAIGRGTQNYTCGTNATAAPSAIGAVADLFNATEVASMYPEMLDIMPSAALQFNFSAKVNTDGAKTLAPLNLELSGHHWFTDLTTPFFNLNAGTAQIGTIPTAKNASTPAPATAMKGMNNMGFGAVPWLKLISKPGATGGLQEVYRLNTAGGSAPATCEGMLSSTITVEYAAEYWFYGM